jgi:hypothetical protein
MQAFHAAQQTLKKAEEQLQQHHTAAGLGASPAGAADTVEGGKDLADGAVAKDKRPLDAGPDTHSSKKPRSSRVAAASNAQTGGSNGKPETQCQQASQLSEEEVMRVVTVSYSAIKNYEESCSHQTFLHTELVEMLSRPPPAGTGVKAAGTTVEGPTDISNAACSIKLQHRVLLMGLLSREAAATVLAVATPYTVMVRVPASHQHITIDMHSTTHSMHW